MLFQLILISIPLLFKNKYNIVKDLDYGSFLINLYFP